MGTSIDHSCTRCVALGYLPDIACHADICAACRNLCNSCNRPHSLDGWILIRPHLSFAILPLILSARLHYWIYTWFFSDGNIQNISLVHFSPFGMVTSKVARTMTIKAFWHNVLFVMFAHIHFAPCDVCACAAAMTNELHRGSSHIHTDQIMRCTNKTKTNIWTSHQSGFYLISHCHIFISCAATDLRFSFDKLKTNLVFGQSPLSTESEFPLIL